ncbi:MAG: hypothetical protein NTX85_03415 [Candidatus Nomurabacteria bacterium]|nr:hypothetical protein [Candidatus Nomurabacteria bacterium]
MEVIVCIALARFFCLKNNKKPDPYKNAVEEVRLEYFPEYDQHEFLGDITKVKNRIKKDGTMALILAKIREGKKYSEISDLLDNKNQEEMDFHKNSYSKYNFESGIALYHYLSAGAVPDCAHDTITPYEASLLGVDPDPKEVFLKQIQEEPIFMVTAKKIRRKIKEKLQLHFDFYDNPDVVMG